jgi:uncharacterized protein YkwD
MGKIKVKRLSSLLKTSKIPKKWLLPVFLLLIFGFVMLWNVTSLAYTKTLKPIFPKAIYISSASKTSTSSFAAAAVLPTPTFTPTPTPVPTFTPTPTPVPTLKPLPSPTSVPFVVQPTAIQTPIVNSSISDYLLGKVNEYRKSQGLSEVKSDSNTCDFAIKRAREISTDFTHDGFKNLAYTSYSKVTENIAMNSDYKEVVNQWIASAGHAENMRADTPFVCIGNSGNYYAYEGWKP